MLVALLLLLVFTLRTTVVSIFSSISCPLVVVISMVFINNPGVMSNNTRMVITRLLFFMAIGLGSDQHGIHQQPWSHVQQYENGDNETLVLHGNRSW